MPLDESAAIAACQAGDLSPFDQLYQSYVRPIYAYLYRRTFHRETAEDLTSVTFIKALERIRTYDASRGTFSMWLYRIARNTLTDHLRTRKQTVDIEDVLGLAAQDDPHADAARSADREKLRKALATLDPVKREIVLLRVWEDLSYKDIAAIVGKSEGNCKVIFSRAMDALRGECGPAALAILLLSSPLLR